MNADQINALGREIAEREEPCGCEPISGGIILCEHAAKRQQFSTEWSRQRDAGVAALHRAFHWMRLYP